MFDTSYFWPQIPQLTLANNRFKKAKNSKKEMSGAQVNATSRDVKLTVEEEILSDVLDIVQED